MKTSWKPFGRSLLIPILVGIKHLSLWETIKTVVNEDGRLSAKGKNRSPGMSEGSVIQFSKRYCT